MPRRSVLSELEKQSLLTIPTTFHELSNVTTQPIFILNALVLLYNLEIEHNLK